MTIPDIDFILAPPRVMTEVALEPGHNALYSLVVLHKAHHKAHRLSGLEDWVERAALTPAQHHTNHLVIEGLHYALPTNQRWPDFLASVNYLAERNPHDLVEQILRAYLDLARPKMGRDGRVVPSPEPADLLADRDLYLTFLQEQFPAPHIDIDLEAEAHGLLNDPPAMQNLMVSHLRDMWETVLAPEWMRVRPLLQESVDAFRQADMSRMSPLEIAEWVVGRPLEEEWETACLKDPEQIIFVPSAHIGPYLGRIAGNVDGRRTLWFFFGARQPHGVAYPSIDLSRSELLTRLNALGDDTRLRILSLLTEHEELCSQDILLKLNLSQSAVSRHVKQLSAAGFLSERSRAAAKCYRLNPRRIEDTLQALEHFLLVK